MFGSLADSTRRDILARVSRESLTIGAIASPYARTMSLAAVSKHVGVLERAELVRKRRRGREQVVEVSPPALRLAEQYLVHYRHIWEQRLDRLEAFLREEKHGKK